MPAVLEQVNRMNADEKLRLVAYIVNSLSGTIAMYGEVAGLKKPATDALRKNKNVFPRPCVSDFIGYGRKFHPEYRSTEDVMRELREGE